jgi:HTH-type transcriptional regulator/antitoxin HigA
MELKLIKTERDYNKALKRLETIFDAKPGSSIGDELEVLGILIEQYENEHFPIGLPDPTTNLYNSGDVQVLNIISLMIFCF